MDPFGAMRLQPTAVGPRHAGRRRFVASEESLELVDGIEPSTSPLPRECSTTELHEPIRTSALHVPTGWCPATDLAVGSFTVARRERRAWSGRPDSNRRHSAWEADALPTELLPHIGGQGWIRTSVGIRQRIYSPSPLTTRAPTHVSLRARTRSEPDTTEPGATHRNRTDNLPITSRMLYQLS